MNRRRGGSPALIYSQAELAYILLLVALGALALLFLQYRSAREEVAFLLERIALMEDRKNAAYPCWVRPDGVIPEIAGTIVIHSHERIEIVRTSGGNAVVGTPEISAAAAAGTEDAGSGAAAGDADMNAARSDRLHSALRALFQDDNQFAARNRCYIRIRVENRTNDYAIYHEVAGVMKGLGIVAVIE